jgi:hypothetical protein
LLASTSDIALERRREKLWNRAHVIGHPALKRRRKKDHDGDYLDEQGAKFYPPKPQRQRRAH